MSIKILNIKIMMDGAIILLKNLHKEMISILKLKMLFLDGETRLQIMLKMKKKEVDGMIIKTIFNLRKDQKIIFKVELVEVKEELKEEEEIVLNVVMKVTCLENVLIKIANKKEWE